MNNKKRHRRCRLGELAVFAALSFNFFAGACRAQVELGLADAVSEALRSRASLKAESQRVAAARAVARQATLRANPEFLFQNENLRPGQTYSRDVDTVAYLSMPLDVLGKRTHRIALANQGIGRAESEYELTRIQLVNAVKLAYWTARGAQEARDLLQASASAFQKVVDYHAARLSAGAIAEQDFLRVRLEHDRLRVSANLAVIEAARATANLLKEINRPVSTRVRLSEPLDSGNTSPPATLDEALTRRSEIRVARARLAESMSKERLETVSARPDLSAFAGYKRTQLPDTTYGVNTIIAGFQITLPITNKNQGNREAASAEVLRDQQLLAAAETDVRAEYESALDEFQMRRDEVVATLQPLRQQAMELEQIATAAYAEGGADLLRLLDAERTRLEADLALARGMTEYHESIVRLEAAEGVGPQ